MITFPKLRPESEDLLNLDALRFVAATGIVLAHVIGQLDLGIYRLSGKSLGLFVDLFFLVSGFVIAHVYGARLVTLADYRAFLVRRVARLIPLHWLILVCFAIIGLFIAGSGASEGTARLFDPSCFIPNALLLHAWGTCSHLSFNAPSWSISAEAAMYLLTPLFLVFAKRKWLGVSTAALSLVLLTISSSPNREWYQWTHDFGVFRA